MTKQSAWAQSECTSHVPSALRASRDDRTNHTARHLTGRTQDANNVLIALYSLAHRPRASVSECGAGHLTGRTRSVKRFFTHCFRTLLMGWNVGVCMRMPKFAGRTQEANSVTHAVSG